MTSFPVILCRAPIVTSTPNVVNFDHAKNSHLICNKNRFTSFVKGRYTQTALYMSGCGRAVMLYKIQRGQLIRIRLDIWCPDFVQGLYHRFCALENHSYFIRKTM